VRSTATKGTVRVLLGLVTLLLTWITAGMVLGDGWAAVASGVAVAAGGVLALVVWPPLTRQVATLIGRIKVRDRVVLVEPVLEARAWLVAAVRAGAASPTEAATATEIATEHRTGNATGTGTEPEAAR
jgi:hypothetical protein